MIKIFNFDYNYEADASFKVDTDKFTPELAKATLEFFIWDYDKENDPVEEVMKKYAMEAIRVSTFNNYNTFGVKNEFDSREGFARLDGSMGIELLRVNGYEFDIDELTMTIS